MENENCSYILSSAHITICFASDGHVVTLYPTQSNFEAVVDAIKDKRWEAARTLSSVSDRLKQYLSNDESDVVYIQDGIVYCDDIPVHQTLSDRLIQMNDHGFDVEPFVLFVQNLMKNPAYHAIQELYLFLESSNLPITPDGHFLAYKMVRMDYMDHHTGKMNNNVGSRPSMKRSLVDDDRRELCSEGLHFCGREYLNFFSNSRLMLVKVNPEHVVCIPSDYNNQKARACTYEVIREITDHKKIELENRGLVQVSKNNYVVQTTPDTEIVVKIHLDLSAASEDTGIPLQYIRRVLNGQRKTTGSFGWRNLSQHEYDRNFEPKTQQVTVKCQF